MEKLVKQILVSSARLRALRWPDNWALKALSFLFAFFLWYFVVGEDKVDMKIFIPLEIVNLPQDLVIANEFKKQLEVTVNGPRVLTRGIANQHIKRPVDLSKAEPGTVMVQNTSESIPLPRGIQILRIQPANIPLTLDRLTQKDLPIKADLQGQPAPGYEQTAVLLEPKTINIAGPQAILEATPFLSTQAIDITDLRETTTREVILDLPPTIAELIGEPVVKATITIQEKLARRQIDRIPIEIKHSAERTVYIVSPATVDVEIELPVNLIVNTAEITGLVRVEIDAGTLPPGTHELKPMALPGNSVHILSVIPEQVTLEIGLENPSKKLPVTP